ncbi:hypothetical protein H312_02071 [Anncaliia algerae PRA339]|uniref:FAR-17a/AIG1-like protein n=1 Tax=Anncaliia algerae PRA339 TaxID=1288291 RepID=A0A059F0K1_9MICR|nr:hypothetical protein H312_02071 [Anncaliia algerae PRA339]
MFKVFAKITLFSFCLLGCFNFGVPLEILEEEKNIYMGKLRHLTTQGLYLTVFTLITGQLLERGLVFLNQFHATMLVITLPLEFLILLMYWTLYIYDPKTLYPAEFYDKNIRTTHFGNLCVHFFPFIALLLEAKEKDLKKKYYHYIIILFFSFKYFAMSHLFFYYNGFFPYPFLNVLSFLQRICLFLGATLLFLILYETIFLLKGNPIENEENKRIIKIK